MQLTEVFDTTRNSHLVKSLAISNKKVKHINDKNDEQSSSMVDLIVSPSDKVS